MNAGHRYLRRSNSSQARLHRYLLVRVQVTQITTDTAREFARKRLDEGLSNHTVNGSLRLLRRMLNIAREDNKIQGVPKIRLLKNSPARKGFLAKEKFDALISFFPANLKPLRDVSLLLRS